MRLLAESCLTRCSEIAHRSLDHEHERAIKWQMHAISRPRSVGYYVIHGCDPMEYDELSTCREVDISNSDNGDLLYWYVVCY